MIKYMFCYLFLKRVAFCFPAESVMITFLLYLSHRFGNILEGDIEACQQIAQQTGILVDPVYTLAAWEMATQISTAHGDADVVMLHTGGTLGIFGLAQRYKSYFGMLNDVTKS